MSVADLLQSVGARLTSLLREPSLGSKGCSAADRDCVAEIFSADTVAQILPYHSYDPETGIFFARESAGFVIEALPLVGADDAAQKEIVSIFQDIMEEGSSLQCLLWADHRVSCFLEGWEAAREKTGGIYEELATRRSRYFKESKKLQPRLYRFILSYSVPAEGELGPARQQQLRETRERLLKLLQAQTYAFVWEADHFVQTLDGLVNFRFDPEQVRRRWDSCELLSAQIPRGGVLRVDEEKLSWKSSTEAQFRSYRVVDYPDSWSLHGMQRLIGDLFRDAYRLQTPFLIHYGVHCPKQEKAERAFRQKMHLIENQGKSSALVRMIPELAEELAEQDFVRRSSTQGNRFVWTQLGVGLWAEPEQLQQAEQALVSLFRINQFGLARNDCLHLPQFLAFLPMTWSEYGDDLKQLNLLKTTIASEGGNLVPLQGEWVGTPSPGMLLLGRRGQLLNWNPFDNRAGNYNAVVVGRSGSGKSVFMQELLVSALGVGARVFILEVGRSFEKTCKVMGGQYIEFARDTPLCLNPFSRISTSDEEERDQYLGMLKSVIATMASPGEGLGDYERALIEKGIRSAWESKQTEATITDVARWLQEQEDSRAQTLGVMLTPYTADGIYARYFEGKNNVDFASPFVLIELEELKEKKDLQSVVLQMFIMSITNQTFLGDRKTPFHICIDEAWDLLRGAQSGDFIETLARRLRKYNGSLVIGTQSVDDFYATPGALAAFENSDWMCLLAQKKSSIQRFAESGKVDMDEHKRVALGSVTTVHGEFSEVMICDSEGSYAIGRLVLDPFSQLLYSSKADEYSRIKELQKSGLSVAEAIDKVIEQDELSS